MDETKHAVYRLGDSLYFTGDVCSESVNEAIMIFDEMLNDNNVKKIIFVIHSYGGVSADGVRLYDYIRLNIIPFKPAEVVINNVAQSSAIDICMAFKDRYISENGTIMIHGPSNVLPEGEYTMENVKYLLDKQKTIRKQVIDIVHKNTGINKSILSRLMNQEREMDANEALHYGFVTGII
jgi:ATP-dependent protease ClpP protease subunit